MMQQILDYFLYTWYDLKQAFYVRKHYYQDLSFRSIDRALLKRYIFLSPYRMSKNYLKKRREKDLYTYGETPLATFEKIAREINIQRSDRILELGCGRGRGVFFLSHFYRCLVIGIERIPQFVKLANHVAKQFNIDRVTFKYGDMLKINWPESNIIYLYGTCLQDQEIDQIIEKIKTFPQGTQILSISYPLIDYDKGKSFELLKRFPVFFPWGETEAFLQVKK